MSYQSIRERIAESLGLDQKSVITFPGSDFGMRGKVVVIFKADTDINNPGEIISRLEPLSQVA
ncbi:hypothetical protein GYA13_04420 [Candidatus Kuenenbacteria bacterium]|nr:hypothetical protein [Candidatus Kuenenbacteria bacterium]